jgi:hypothetical protein
MAKPAMRDLILRWPVFILAALTMAAGGFVAYPGCATPTPDASPAVLTQRGFYDSALPALEKKKRRGELAGIEPTAAGTFSVSWYWYDQTKPSDERQLRVVFKYADGRPDREFLLVSSGGSSPPDWQPLPMPKQQVDSQVVVKEKRRAP